jgi:antitoxin MazE
MEAVISKWGNSLALRIPHPFAQETKLVEGSKVDVVLEEGRIVINPYYTLEGLLMLITPENLHTETQTNHPQGNEEW